MSVVTLDEAIIKLANLRDELEGEYAYYQLDELGVLDDITANISAADKHRKNIIRAKKFLERQERKEVAKVATAVNTTWTYEEPALWCFQNY